MTNSDKLLAAFTPSIMSHETLEAIFVRREALTSRIMEDLGTGATTRSKRHVLLVGPRGIGKTHLISLVYHRAKADPVLENRLKIAWLREEMWEVASFLDLMECIISALAVEYDDDVLASGVAELKTLTVENAERSAERLLLDYLKDCILLLLIENLDDVFDALGEIGERQLRAFLQNHTNTIIIGSTPGLFYGVSDHDSPFYGFFNVTHLDELTIEDATLLLRKIADIREDVELAAFLETEAGHDRLAAVQHLAGGHPRIWIFFAGIVTHDTLDELVPAFLEMLDDLTPYYQSRMKELPPQQRKVISYLCVRRGSAVVKDIAEACRLSPQAAAAQLHELREKGFVRSESTGRESWYELREPLLRLVLEVKESRGRPIRLIVDFLRNWYSRPERLDKYARLPVEACVTRRYVEAALDLRGFADSDPRRHNCIREGSVPYVDFLPKDRAKAVLAAAQAIEDAGSGVTARHWNLYGICLSEMFQYDSAVDSFNRAIELDPRDPIAYYNRGITFDEAGRDSEALLSYDMAIRFAPMAPLINNYRGISLDKAGRFVEAIESFNAALRFDPMYADAYVNLAISLRNEGRLSESIESLGQAIKIDTSLAAAHYNLGVSLYDDCRFEEAIASHDKAIALDYRQWKAHNNRGACLARLSRHAEAVASFNRAIGIDLSALSAYINRGMSLGALGLHEMAVESFEQYIHLASDDVIAYGIYATSLLALDRWDDFLSVLERGFETPDGGGNWSDASSYCRLLMLRITQSTWLQRVAMLVDLYDRNACLKWLGVGLVQAVPALFEQSVSDSSAELWQVSWHAAGHVFYELELPLRLLDAAVRWKKKPDRRILLALPEEERRILQEILPIQEEGHTGTVMPRKSRRGRK